MITLGTAEGDCLFEQAYQIAKKGYRVLAVYYFGKETLRPKLAHVPLEFFHMLFNLQNSLLLHIR
ncbi:hypothetical protein [Enterococcus saccharolyticus]|uniref:hypothetical protein n=1 Tax=Enterococcus saccharolyticus TaxID=41997 RepID=UPI0003A67619|nr:hypothetical protein [Enterococcus saccharolyticus]